MNKEQILALLSSGLVRIEVKESEQDDETFKSDFIDLQTDIIYSLLEFSEKYGINMVNMSDVVLKGCHEVVCTLFSGSEEEE